MRRPYKVLTKLHTNCFITMCTVQAEIAKRIFDQIQSMITLVRSTDTSGLIDMAQLVGIMFVDVCIFSFLDVSQMLMT